MDDANKTDVGEMVTRTTTIADVGWRQRVRVKRPGGHHAVEPPRGAWCSNARVLDDTGGMSLVSLGRRRIAGIDIGTSITAEGW